MRKFLLVILSVLLIAGMGYASEIFVNPQEGPMLLTVPVYNNAAVTLGTGSVAIWDFGSSTGDDDNYVTTTTSADTFPVAGVVYPADIASGKTGSIVVYGIVDCDTLASTVATAGQNLCTSTTAGVGYSCATDAGSALQYGVTTAAPSGGTGKCFVNTR